MADKEIIIDGVDVSKCIFFSKGITHNLCKEPHEVDEECKYNHNCYFKQLKIKEQECEELKKEKAEIKKYLGISDKTIIQRLEELQEFKDKLKISEYSYKQALDEIEKTIDNGTADTQTNNAKWLHEYYLARYCEIRDIINKVKEQ